MLAEAGLVEVDKGYEGKRPRTWVRITRDGRRALAAEMEALSALVRRHSAAPEPAAREPEPGRAVRSGSPRPEPA